MMRLGWGVAGISIAHHCSMYVDQSWPLVKRTASVRTSGWADAPYAGVQGRMRPPENGTRE
jgi:hypothetical protein